jgi:hypothetical protein
METAVETIKLRCPACGGARHAGHAWVHVYPWLRRISNGTTKVRVKCDCGWHWWTKDQRALLIGRRELRRRRTASREQAAIERRRRSLPLAIHTHGGEETVRAAAEFLAREIQNVVMAGEREVADAIEAALRTHRQNAADSAEQAFRRWRAHPPRGAIRHAVTLLRWWAVDATDDPGIIEMMKQSREAARELAAWDRRYERRVPRACVR